MSCRAILAIVYLLVASPVFAAGTDEGFVALFDGKTLDGWQGGKDGYEIVDGAIVCKEKGGGNLYTAKEYADFHLKFEFKLTPGANNGIGIRTPLEGDPAFVGMEIQVLDDSSEHYRNIKEWQHHGSVYGVVPAKTGHQKPVGEWNSEEIIVHGKQVKVILNGETIVDADVEKAGTPKTLDGRDHPGLNRDKGYIGFCGHGAHVEYRNLRLQELK
jgi:3-keto-disaccharide hydrolase